MTVRRGRMSGHVARFVHAELAKRPGVETELVDIRELKLSDAEGFDPALGGVPEGFHARPDCGRTRSRRAG